MAKHYLNLSKILQRLLFDKKMKPVDLAREVDLPQPTIHRLVTGKTTRPYKTSLEPIARYFSISVDQLLGEEPFESGAPIYQLPENSKSFRQVPVISWEEIVAFIEGNLSDSKSVCIMGNEALSDKAFATHLNDASMKYAFPREATLVFDPLRQPKDGDYVLVKLQDANIPILRWLLIDGEHKYLKPFNPDLGNFKIQLLDEQDIIVAVLAETRVCFNKAN